MYESSKKTYKLWEKAITKNWYINTSCHIK